MLCVSLIESIISNVTHRNIVLQSSDCVSRIRAGGSLALLARSPLEAVVALVLAVLCLVVLCGEVGEVHVLLGCCSDSLVLVLEQLLPRRLREGVLLG